MIEIPVRFTPILFVALAIAGVVTALRSYAAEGLPLSELSQVTHFHGIAVDQKNPSHIYLATHDGLFVVFPDGLATPLSPDSDFMGFTPHPVNPSVLYASGHTAGGSNLGFVMSPDGGKTWQQLSKGMGGPVDFHQIDINKVQPTTIYGIFDGIQVSTDGGRTWTLSGPGPDDMIDLAASANEADGLYPATKRGLLISQDRGRSWLPAYIHGLAATMVETTPNRNVFALVVGKGLIKGMEPSLRWRVLSRGFGEQYILDLAVDPTNEDHLYVVTNKDEVLESRDGGQTWTTFGAR